MELSLPGARPNHRFSRFANATLRLLPEGRPLPDPVWQRRHDMMVGLLLLHAAAVVAVALYTGAGLQHSLSEGAIPALVAMLAGSAPLSRRIRAVLSSVGLVMTSAIFVHLSGGTIEMHFHFFVMIAVITLYQDWVPFLFAIGFVVLHHGTIGVLDSSAVYNHPDAVAHPWKWAAVHGAFVLAESVACIASWRLNEDARSLTEQVLGAVGEGIYVLDTEGRMTFGNPASSSMLGWNPDTMIGREERTILATSRAQEQAPGPGEGVLQHTAARNDGTTTFRRGDGSAFPVAFVATPLAERGRVTGAVVAFNDITDQLHAEEEVRFRLLFASNPHPMWVSDLETLAFLEVNEAAVEQYGYSRAEFLGMKLAEISAHDAVGLLRIDGTEGQAAVQSRHLRRSGEVFDVALTSHRLDFAGRPAALVVAQDVSERLRFEEQLAHQALHDSLTGLPNRALFSDRLDHAMVSSQRDGRAIAVLFLDLDGFKVINDSLGHAVGDEVLVAISQRLVGAVPVDSTVARFGGDEFLILLEHLEQRDQASSLAQSLLAVLRPPVSVPGGEVFVTASIGLALYSAASKRLTADDLVREADIAMYQAKASGKAQAVIFDAGMDTPAVTRLELETDLRRAVERDELRLHYQPEMDVRTGELTGFEALVRWQHPERGLLPPLAFIPIAEETGLIVPIGKWVLRRACWEAQGWQSTLPAGRPLVVGINVSARQISQPGFANDVAAILGETGLAPECLRLEITESTAMQDAGRMIAALTELRALGVDIAIDDFGTGYSSLSYLSTLPVSTLKIDRSFVSALGSDPGASAIVEAVIAVAHSLSMKVTAEGIETADQLTRLIGLDCDGGQGFHLARPLLPAEVEALLGRAVSPTEVDLASETNAPMRLSA